VCRVLRLAIVMWVRVGGAEVVEVMEGWFYLGGGDDDDCLCLGFFVRSVLCYVTYE
jgi:hypothetical protein